MKGSLRRFMSTRSILTFLALGAVGMLSSGCASIIKGGGPQSVSIRSMPSDATVMVIDEKSGNTLSSGRTPLMLSLNKSKGFFSGSRYRVVIEKPGFETREVLIDSSVSGWYIGGNLLFGGLIGWLIVDPATGAMWTLDPEEVSVELKATQTATSAEKPVALMLKDDIQAQHPELLGKMKPLPTALQ